MAVDAEALEREPGIRLKKPAAERIAAIVHFCTETKVAFLSAGALATCWLNPLATRGFIVRDKGSPPQDVASEESGAGLD